MFFIVFSYDNGWKYLKRLGLAVALIFVWRCINVVDVAPFEPILVIVGATCYGIAAWKNYTTEVCELLEASSYSEVPSRMQQKIHDILDNLPNDQMKSEFQRNYASLEKMVDRAAYLKQMDYRYVKTLKK